MGIGKRKAQNTMRNLKLIAHSVEIIQIIQMILQGIYEHKWPTQNQLCVRNGWKQKTMEKRTQETHWQCSVLNKDSSGGSQLSWEEMQGKSFPVGSWLGWFFSDLRKKLKVIVKTLHNPSHKIIICKKWTPGSSA